MLLWLICVDMMLSCLIFIASVQKLDLLICFSFIGCSCVFGSILNDILCAKCGIPTLTILGLDIEESFNPKMMY